MHLRGVAWLALVSLPGSSAAFAESLDEILAGMDRAAPSFKTFSADLTSVTYTAVIQESSTEKGTILLKRGKHEMTMLVDFAGPNRKSVAVQGQKLEIYYPEQKSVEEYDISQYRYMIDQFMLIGFGTSGKELAEAYNVKLAGEDTVAGQKASRLELTPKSPEVLKNLKKLELWIPKDKPYPVQQKIYLPAGDYRLFTYTNVKMNPPLTDSDLKIKVPKDTKRVSPQS